MNCGVERFWTDPRRWLIIEPCWWDQVLLVHAAACFVLSASFATEHAAYGLPAEAASMWLPLPCSWGQVLLVHAAECFESFRPSMPGLRWGPGAPAGIKNIASLIAGCVVWNRPQGSATCSMAPKRPSFEKPHLASWRRVLLRQVPLQHQRVQLVAW